MRPILFVVGSGAIVLACLGATAFGCNSVLGIDSASPEPVDAGPGGKADTGAFQTSYTLSCSNYCTLMSEACGPTSAAGDNTEYLGADGSVCNTICPNSEPTGEVLDPATEPTPDNTLNCRVWHANAALIGDPHIHCAHAGPLGGDMCDPNASDPCTPFCTLDLALCTGANQVYASVADCLAACRPDGGYGGFPYNLNTTDTEITDLATQFQSGSNTLNCRMYHLENAVFFGDPGTHCPHTSAGGGGICVDPNNGDE